MLKYAILSVSLITVMAGAMIAPAVASIAAAFPDASKFQINLVTSLHAGLVLPFTFISGFFVRYYSKKNILLVSTVLYVIAGIGGSFSPDINFMLVTRALLGIAVGIMIPISITLISDYYTGEERTRTLGLQSAATNLGGIIAIVVSGFLATLGWNFSFYAYGMGAIIFFVVMFLIPNKKPKPYEKESVNNKIDSRVYLLAVYMILTFVVFYGIPSNMSLFLKELDVTNTITNGVIIAVCSLGGFLGGLGLAYFRKIFKTFFIPFQVSFMAIGFALIVFGSSSLYILGLGTMILGFGYGSTVPIIFDTASKISKGAAAATATALLVSSIYLGQFISPLILGFVSRTFGDGSVAFAYTMIAFALILVAAILVSNKLLRFTGIKDVIKRNRSKYLFAQISSQQSELHETVNTLSSQFQKTLSQRDELLIAKLDALTVNIKTISSRLDELSQKETENKSK